MSTIDPGPEDAASQTTTATEPLREARVLVPADDYDSIGIAELVSLLRTAELRDFGALDCHERGAVIEAAVEEPLDAAALTEATSIERWYRVAADQHPTYVLELAAPAFPPSIATRTAGVIGLCEPSLTDRGLDLTVVGSQAAIAEAIASFERTGAHPELLSLGTYDGPESPVASLTERQREVVQTAYEIGYYEVPREVSTERLAAELGIDSSTASEHLRRAERNLLTRQFGPVDGAAGPSATARH